MHTLLKSFASARSLIPAAATLAMVGALAALAGCDAQPGTSASAASVVPAAQAAPAAPAVAPASQPQTRAQVFEGVKQMTALGKQLFFDPSLSGSGKLACASCHSAEHAFGPPNALSVQLGGDDMHRTGFRAVPSLKYLRGIPPFSEHFHDSPDEGDESIDAGPTGGLTWDGRVDTRGAQARIPLTSPFEMSSSPARVAKAVRAAPYADAFRKAFGDQVLGDDRATFDAVLRALDAFQQQPALFDPYTSKYDAYLAGHAQLTPAELHGLQLFNDEKKGNCASCHISQRTLEGGPPQFSDFGLIAIAVPRNRALPVNRDPRFYDLGACGPERTDLKGRDEFCGLFRTPSLRNVALRKTFFHNGVYHSLEDVMRFYVERDIHPEKFYPVVHGKVQIYDDLPKRYWPNINREAPFDRKRGDQPALNAAEIKDVIAFLGTLTDGYQQTAALAKP